MPIEESAIAGQNRGTEAPVGRREDAVAARFVPEAAAELIEVLACGVRPRLEVACEAGDPVVVVDELVLVDVRIVHAVDASRLERAVVRAGRADEVSPAARLVQIVVEVGACGDDAVHGAFVDEPGDREPEPPGGQGAGDPEEDHDVIGEHPLPDPMGGGEVASLEGDPLHPPEQLGGRSVRHDLERLDRGVEEARLVVPGA